MVSLLSTSTPLFLLLMRVFLLIISSASLITGAYSKMPLFAEYIGAEYYDVTFSDVPINPNVNFHFILSFAIDYKVKGNTATPTDGHFNIFWQSEKLTPSSVASIKKSHSSVQVALSLGGDTVGSKDAVFSASAVSTWVNNAVTSLTKIINDYHLDGIDIDYEHFKSDKTTFVECIGQLLTKLKNKNLIKFASIAPFSDPTVEEYYTALFQKYGNLINYINFQFYAYDKGTTVQQFLRYYEEQSSKYNGSKLLVSFSTENDAGGLSPERGFFTACKTLKKQGKLHGIFVYSADNSFKNKDFKPEKQAQMLLAGGN